LKHVRNAANASLADRRPT